MLRKISMLVASAALVGGLSAVPVSAAMAAPRVPTHTFTVPTIKNHNVVTGWGWYRKYSNNRVWVKVCTKQTGNAFAVGAQAVVSNSRGKTKNISGVILQGHKGQVSCGQMTFIFYGTHMWVHTFVGQGGHIIARSYGKKIF